MPLGIRVWGVHVYQFHHSSMCPMLKHGVAFYFFLQLSRNKIPVSNAGQDIVSDRQNIICRGTQFMAVMIMYASHASINVMAPTNSYFRLMMRMIVRIMDGILCINKPTTVHRNHAFKSNTSSENIARNRMKRMARILGARVRNLWCKCFFILFF